MQDSTQFSIFSDDEEKVYLRWRTFKDIILKVPVAYLARLRVKADWLSWTGFLMVLPFIYFFKFNPWIAFIFILLNVLFDALDGTLARFYGRVTSKGKLMDIFWDNLSFLVFFMTVFYYGVFSYFWGAVYMGNYIVLLFLVAISSGMKIKVFPVIRSRLYFFGMLFIFLTSGFNFFDYFLVFFSVYMMITNFFLFQRIKWTF